MGFLGDGAGAKKQRALLRRLACTPTWLVVVFVVCALLATAQLLRSPNTR